MLSDSAIGGVCFSEKTRFDSSGEFEHIWFLTSEFSDGISNTDGPYDIAWKIILATASDA